MDLLSLMTGVEKMEIDSRYRVVIITAQRARQLMRGVKPKITSKFNKETTVALDETFGGKVEYIIGKEARAALKEARLKESVLKPKVFPSSTEDSGETKKDSTPYMDNLKPKNEG